MLISILKEFVILAQIGNYSAAADPLAVSEATLSRHIMALEKELGTPLFIRHPRYLELTDAGLLFLPYAEKIVAAENACFAAVKRCRVPRKRQLSIGFDEAFGYYGIPQLLAQFQANHPDVTLYLQSGESFSLREQLAAGQIQFAFLWHDPAFQKAEFQTMHYSSDSMCILLPNVHPQASRKRIHLSSLQESSILLPPPLTALYELCMKAFHAAGMEPEQALSANLSSAAAAELIRCGFGVALLPRRIAQALCTDALTVRDCVTPADVGICLLFRSGAHAQIEQCFLNFLTQGGYCHEA